MEKPRTGWESIIFHCWLSVVLIFCLSIFPLSCLFPSFNYWDNQSWVRTFFSNLHVGIFNHHRGISLIYTQIVPLHWWTTNAKIQMMQSHWKSFTSEWIVDFDACAKWIFNLILRFCTSFKCNRNMRCVYIGQALINRIHTSKLWNAIPMEKSNIFAITVDRRPFRSLVIAPTETEYFHLQWKSLLFEWVAAPAFLQYSIVFARILNVC